MARPSSLTADAEEEILQGLTAGYGGEVAAEAAGIPATTWYGWMRAAREGDPRYQRLLEALTASRRRRRQARRVSPDPRVAAKDLFARYFGPSRSQS